MSRSTGERFSPVHTSYWGAKVAAPPRSIARLVPAAVDGSVDYHGDGINALYWDGHVEFVPRGSHGCDPLAP